MVTCLDSGKLQLYRVELRNTCCACSFQTLNSTNARWGGDRNDVNRILNSVKNQQSIEGVTRNGTRNTLENSLRQYQHA